jgi:hypothetical protein
MNHKDTDGFGHPRPDWGEQIQINQNDMDGLGRPNPDSDIQNQIGMISSDEPQ